jgi:hypothetical protein
VRAKPASAVRLTALNVGMCLAASRILVPSISHSSGRKQLFLVGRQRDLTAAR